MRGRLSRSSSRTRPCPTRSASRSANAPSAAAARSSTSAPRSSRTGPTNVSGGGTHPASSPAAAARQLGHARPEQVQEIGSHDGRDWFTHSENSVKDVELEAQPRLLDLDHGDALPNESISKVVVKDADGDERALHRLYHCYPKGTLAQLTASGQKTEEKSKPQRYVDLLGRFPVLYTRPRNHDRPEPIRGAKRIIDRLERKGVQVRLSPDRQSIIPSGNSLYFPAAYAAAPLLWPYLHDGTPPTCQVHDHKEPVEGTTVVDAFPDGLAACGVQP